MIFNLINYDFDFYNNYNFFNLNYFLLKIFKSSWSKNIFLKKNNILLIEVDINSNKLNIKKSVELIFGIKVLSVNTNILKTFYYNFKRKNIIKKKKAYIKFLN